MKSLEEYKDEYAIYDKKAKIGTTIIIISFLLFLPSGGIGFSSGLFFLPFLVMAGFMAGGVISGIYHNKMKLLINEFKTQYMPKAIESILPGSEFNVNGGFDEMELYRSRILSKADRYHTEDQFIGEWDGIKFKTADVTLKDVRSNGKSTTVVTVFQGRVYRLDFPIPFLTDMLVYQNRFIVKWGFGEFEQVETESIDFNHSFQVLAKDSLNAFRILKPDFMEKLMALDQQTVHKIALSFQGEHLYIAIDTREDTLDYESKLAVLDTPTLAFEKTLQLIKDFIAFFKVLDRS